MDPEAVTNTKPTPTAFSEKQMSSSCDQLILAHSHGMLAGGRFYLAAKRCGYQDGLRHIELATMTEYMHAATLVHDDMVN
jgi:geranylgeranyl pyrophosphate synthase